jgi:hypothetical protein
MAKYTQIARLHNNSLAPSLGARSIPIGGHWAPNSTVGVNALWKKAQNIAKKNNASDTINSITPKFNPFCTAKVWLPKKVPSDIISLNQKDIDEITSIKDIIFKL